VGCSEWYRWFGEHDARGRSPSYARLALAVADDAELCARIDALPPPKQQPNLLFAAVRYRGGPTDQWAAFRDFATERWSELVDVMVAHSTQTNEAGRCASLVPVLAGLPQPVSLIELGTSAGLCLYPDRYQYRYDDTVVGASPVVIDVACTGPVPVPEVLPEVVGRVGVDLTPRDVTDPDDRAWLRACIWPEQLDRQARFEAAAEIVAADPPQLVTADLVEALADVVDAAPDAATTVVFHSAVAIYLSDAQRDALTHALRDRVDVVWISNEAPGLFAGLETAARPPAHQNQESYMEIGVGGREVVGLTGPHGSWVAWPPSSLPAGAR